MRSRPSLEPPGRGAGAPSPFRGKVAWGLVALAVSGSCEARTGDARARASGPARAAAPLDAVTCFEGALPAGVPRRLSGFCARAAAREARATGEFSLLEASCASLLGPGCADRYLGVRRVEIVPYVDERGGGGAIDLTLLTFESAEHSHAAYTLSLIGDRDPALLAAQPLDEAGLSVLTEGRALAFRGPELALLEYDNERETLEERQASARLRLPQAVAALGVVNAPGGGVPEAVGRLPSENRLPLGVRFFVEDALGVPGLGPNAQGYYREGNRRWRALAIVRDDVDAAKDVISTLRRHPDSRKMKYAPLGAMRFTERRGGGLPHVRWMIGRWGRIVFGVGDEASVLPRFVSAEDEAKRSLSDQQKLLKLSRIHLG